MSSNLKVNHQIPSAVIDIIKNSKDFCFIISPYYQPWKQLLKVLELAASEQKNIIFLFRDDQIKNENTKMLNTLFKFDVFFINNLHAKIYLNEKEALISSMNLYDYSKENNFEIAYSITNSYEVKNIAKLIIVGEMIKVWATSSLPGRSSEFIKEIMNNPSSNNISSRTFNSYCISCKKRIPYNFNSPFCSSCLKTVQTSNNNSSTGHYCHKCGIEASTFLNKPLCLNCFIKTPNVHKM